MSNTIFKKIATQKVSHATAQFLRHEVHPLKLFPGAVLIRSHRCKRRRCTDGLPQSCTVAQEAADQAWRRRNVCLPAAAPSAP